MTRALYIALGAVGFPAFVAALCYGIAALVSWAGSTVLAILAGVFGVLLFGFIGACIGQEIYDARRRRWR